MGNKLRDIIIGTAIGDAMGVPLEFCSRVEAKHSGALAQADSGNVFHSYGTHHQPEGTWSDDTSMMLCIAEQMREDNEDRKLNINALGWKFIKWYRNGYMTPHGSCFDIGHTTRESLERGLNPSNTLPAKLWGAIGNNQNGNGSLMRTLPLALWTNEIYSADERFMLAEDVSGITHNHMVSRTACHILLEFARNLLKSKEKVVAYHDTVADIAKLFENVPVTGRFVREQFNRILLDNLMRLEEDDIQSSGYVIDTLEAAMWCFLTTENYSDCVIRAVELGDDTDTIGAVAGGLAGLYYGIESIPENWINSLVKKKELYEWTEWYQSGQETTTYWQKFMAKR